MTNSSSSDPGSTRTPSRARSHWVLLGIFGGLFLLFFFFATLVIQTLAPEGAGENQIGVITIEGPIVSAERTLADIRAFVEDDNIKGILVRIDSPGGAVGASQEIFAAIRRAAKKKKLAISLGNIAASGGFYIACAARPVFANPGTITGSIGVISQTVEAHELMAFLRLEFNTIKSGRFKDAGSPFRDFTPEDRAVYEGLVKEIYRQFVDDVAASRGLDVEAFRRSTFVDGRVFTGAEAGDEKLKETLGGTLVDRIGGMEDAIDYLSKELDFKGPPTLVHPERPSAGLLGALIDEGASAVRGELRQMNAPTFEYRYATP